MTFMKNKPKPQAVTEAGVYPTQAAAPPPCPARGPPECEEETGLPAKALALGAEHTQVHPDWSYTTFTAQAPPDPASVGPGLGALTRRPRGPPRPRTRVTESPPQGQLPAETGAKPLPWPFWVQKAGGRP